MYRDGTSQEARSIAVELEPECLAQPPRTPGDLEGGIPRCQSPVLAHALDTFEGLGGTQENRRAATPRFADEVDTHVDAVAPVGIEATRGPEHASVAPGRSAVGMRGGIAAVAEVRLHFHQSPHQAGAVGESSNEPGPQQFRGHFEARAIEEGSGKRSTEGHTGRLAPAGSCAEAPREFTTSRWRRAML